jgi:hypothetical protein
MNKLSVNVFNKQFEVGFRKYNLIEILTKQMEKFFLIKNFIKRRKVQNCILKKH